MNPKFKITIPEPCNENWDKMTPDETGRFCSACNKSVIDFSNKLPEEIQHFFLKNQDQKICGRFKNSQLDSITIQIPSQVVFSQTQYHKIFLLALFIIMGTSLFSCTDKNGNKHKIEKIEIVKDSLKIKKTNFYKSRFLKSDNYTVKNCLPIKDSIIEQDLFSDPSININGGVFLFKNRNKQLQDINKNKKN